MAAPPDLDIARAFLEELLEAHEVLSREPQTALSAYLYLASAITSGSWVDPKYFSDQANNVIKSLKCYPLLQPYLNHASYSQADLIASKVAHSLS